MIRRLVKVLLAAAIVLSPLAVASPAQAAERDCWTSLSTGYGPVWVCTLYSGNDGRAALYSPLTKQYSYQSGWLRAGFYIIEAGMVTATDGYRGYFFGGSALATAYGDASFGVQYRGTSISAGSGRFGWYNLVTKRFYPSSGWLSTGG